MGCSPRGRKELDTNESLTLSLALKPPWPTTGLYPVLHESKAGLRLIWTSFHK